MIETGEVVKVENDEAVIKIRRHSMCSKCNNKCQLAAGMEHESDEIEVRVNNDLQAKAGERVELEMHERPLVTASIIIYLIPLLALIAGYYISEYVFVFIGYTPGEYLNIVGALVFLLLAFGLISRIDNILGKRKEYRPQIIKILDK